jgi:hypothetical protein
MHRPWFSFAIASVLSLAFVPHWVRAEDAPKKEQKVFVEVCVAEVSLSKLRALGFDWDAAHSTFEPTYRTNDDPLDLLSFVEALGKDDLARVLSHPRLATMSGRTASLQVGDAKGQGVRLELVPQVLDTQKIQLQYRIELNLSKPAAAGEVNDRRHATRELVLDSATEFAPGIACCVSETRSRRTNEQGKTEETVTIVLLRADFKPPADIRTAEKPQPPKPVLERRYPEIEIPKRR